MNRLPEYLIVGWVIITANFFLPRLVPGDALLQLTGEVGGDAPVELDESARAKLRRHHALDVPPSRQYLEYLRGVFTGDLGYSVHRRTSVMTLLRRTLPWTLLLTVTAFCLSTGLGTGFGVLSAWKRGSLVDRALLASLTGMGAVPSFLIALLLYGVFAVHLGFFPVSGAVTFYESADGFQAKIVDVLWHSTLPMIALTLVLLPENYLLVRSAMINALGADYVFVARMKGLSSWAVMYRHALRSALAPLLTHVSLRLSLAVGGMVFVEAVFSYPGMGNLLYRSVTSHDYPVTQGVLLVITLCVLTANFVLDLSYRRLDPRISRS